MDTRSVVSSGFDSMSPVELIAIGAQLSPARETVRLERILAPATREQRLSAIISMMGQFGVSAPKGEEEGRLFFEGYLLALEGYPTWCIHETCRAFVRGTVDVSNREFMPKPATIGAELAKRVDDFRMRLGRARKQADEVRQLGMEQTGPLTPELRRKGEECVARLRAHADAERENIRKPTGPDLSPYYAKRAEEPSRLSPPLTEEDLKDVPLAPKRTGAFQKVAAALSPDHLPEQR